MDLDSDAQDLFFLLSSVKGEKLMLRAFNCFSAAPLEFWQLSRLKGLFSSLNVTS